MEPFRLRVLKALSAQIKTVTPANGATVDLSDFTDEAGRPAERVFRGRDIFGYSDPLPMVSIQEHPEALLQSNAPGGGVGSTGEYDILVQGFVQDDPLNPTDPAHWLAAHVVQALAEAKKDRRNILGFGNRGPCVTKMEIGAPVVRPADDETSAVAFFFLKLRLTLVEDLENPFLA